MIDTLIIVGWVMVGVSLATLVFTGIAAYDEHQFKQGK